MYTRQENDPRVDEALLALGEAVRQIRVARGLSQSALQARSGVHQSIVSRFERGQAPGLRVEAVACMLAALRGDRAIRHWAIRWLEEQERRVLREATSSEAML